MLTPPLDFCLLGRIVGTGTMFSLKKDSGGAVGTYGDIVAPVIIRFLKIALFCGLSPAVADEMSVSVSVYASMGESERVLLF